MILLFQNDLKTLKYKIKINFFNKKIIFEMLPKQPDILANGLEEICIGVSWHRQKLWVAKLSKLVSRAKFYANPPMQNPAGNLEWNEKPTMLTVQ